MVNSCSIGTAVSNSPRDVVFDQVSRAVPPFLVCLFEILTKEDASVIAWCDDGKAFSVYDVDVMERHILPTYFRHSKYSSFQRQLNYFGFRKLHKTNDRAASYSQYLQPNFVKGDPSRLLLIQRKINRMKVRSSIATIGTPQFDKADTSPTSPCQASVVLDSPILCHDDARLDITQPIPFTDTATGLFSPDDLRFFADAILSW
ncbi:Aste57867_11626 [Aphanomyces stellatus]|uniref:Aste57867_11626 protein n=1 Tax=Aphanomyces stellatus TaxID=120398 RepID=A0A485KTH3_9STRA|nr:hypothetical protein As57867_011583 [Aphanomyces stellatus]VFT88484.1 Aste57867_11626 [Aphanomyces stellatus]